MWILLVIDEQRLLFKNQGLFGVKLGIELAIHVIRPWAVKVRSSCMASSWSDVCVFISLSLFLIFLQIDLNVWSLDRIPCMRVLTVSEKLHM